MIVSSDELGNAVELRYPGFTPPIERESHLRDVQDMAIRVLDFVITVALLAFLLPIMLLVAVGCWLSPGGTVLFAHTRVGWNGQLFRCLKFRTMVLDAERRLAEILATDPLRRLEWEADRKLRDDPRVTALGRILRVTSLDELPQLFNILRGEMSLVGPRPIIKSEVALYGHYFQHYCRVRPGLTGLWQISGRNDVSYRRRVALDVAYAKKRSIGLYLSVLVRTPACVLLSRGCY